MAPRGRLPIPPDVFGELIRRVGCAAPRRSHAGVLAGAAEVRKHQGCRASSTASCCCPTARRTSAPAGRTISAVLGRALLAEGISVSTIGLGLGYNEDLMLALARASDGNHAFARDPSDLVQIFNREFNDVLASCAQTVALDIDLKPGVRAVRALSRDGTIAGSKAQFRLNQVYAATEHYVLIEVEIDDGRRGGGRAGAGQRQGGLHAGSEKRPADAPRRRARPLHRLRGRGQSRGRRQGGGSGGGAGGAGALRGRR